MHKQTIEEKIIQYFQPNNSLNKLDKYVIYSMIKVYFLNTDLTNSKAITNTTIDKILQQKNKADDNEEYFYF